MFTIDLRDSPLLRINLFFLIHVRTSIIHSFEIVDFPKKLTDKNVVKHGLLYLHTPTVNTVGHG